MIDLFRKPIVVVTHSGTFHADEIFAIATLRLYFKDQRLKIVRTRDPKLIDTGDIVLDVGSEYEPEKKRFDHHQKGGAGERSNGIPYASFGLIWKHFGEKVSGSAEVFKRVDEELVSYIDLIDNGLGEAKPLSGEVFQQGLSSVIASFNPTWSEAKTEKEISSKFFEALKIADSVLSRFIKRAEAEMTGAKKVVEFYQKSEDKRLIILDKRYPWRETLVKFSEPLFVLAPNDNANLPNSWTVTAVPKSDNSFESRKLFPKNWSGLRDGELVNETGVPEAIFCHNKLFFAVASSKEGALKMAKIALAS